MLRKLNRNSSSLHIANRLLQGKTDVRILCAPKTKDKLYFNPTAPGLDHLLRTQTTTRAGIIKTKLCKNTYRGSIIQAGMPKVITKFTAFKKEGPQKLPMHLKPPWIIAAVRNCYGATELQLMFSIECILPAVYKDDASSLQRSNIVYEYVCRCNYRYTSAAPRQDYGTESTK